MLSIEQESPDWPESLHLLDLADARSAELYPAERRFGLSADALLAQKACFFIARLNGQAIGCAGYTRPEAGYAELKRLFVRAEARRGGIGETLVLAAERTASAERVLAMRLETGIKSVEALTLYRRMGYSQRAPFGSYRDDPLSVFMERRLAPS